MPEPNGSKIAVAGGCGYDMSRWFTHWAMSSRLDMHQRRFFFNTLASMRAALGLDAVPAGFDVGGRFDVRNVDWAPDSPFKKAMLRDVLHVGRCVDLFERGGGGRLFGKGRTFRDMKHFLSCVGSAQRSIVTRLEAPVCPTIVLCMGGAAKQAWLAHIGRHVPSAEVQFIRHPSASGGYWEEFSGDDSSTRLRTGPVPRDATPRRRAPAVSQGRSEVPGAGEFYHAFFEGCQAQAGKNVQLPPLQHSNGQYHARLRSTNERHRQPGWEITLAGPRGAKVRTPSIGFELSTPVASTEPTDASWQDLRGRFGDGDGWVISYGQFEGAENRLCRCVKPLVAGTLIVGADEDALDAVAKRTVDALLPVWVAIPR